MTTSSRNWRRYARPGGNRESGRRRDPASGGRPRGNSISRQQLLKLLRHEYPEYVGPERNAPFDPQRQRDEMLARHPELIAMTF